ncbi:MAG: hypothetical protein ACR2GY_09755 [Phycisphaerales bacterium]
MPDPPATNTFTNLLFENGWLLPGVTLVAAICCLAWWYRSEQRERTPLLAALALLVLAGAMWTIERITITSGEAAIAATTAMLRDAASANVTGVLSHFADDAVMAMGQPTNPGVGLDEIRRRASTLNGRYRVEGMRTLQLDGFSHSDTTATVHLRITTRFGGNSFAVPSSWVLRFERAGDGAMKIKHMTFVEYGLRTVPGNDVFR